MIYRCKIWRKTNFECLLWLVVQNTLIEMEQKSAAEIDKVVKQLQDTCFATIFYVPMAVLTVAMLFLITAIVIIFKSAKNQRGTMTGKIVVCQSATMFVGFLVINIILGCLRQLIYDPTEASLIFFMIIFGLPLLGALYLSSHFWLNIQCFDVFYNFRSVENSPSNAPRGSHRCRFAIYCLYAILLPIVLVYTTANYLLQKDSSEEDGIVEYRLAIPKIYKIEYFSAIFSSTGFLAFAVPVLILNALNLFFIFITRRNASKMRREMENFDGDLGKEEPQLSGDVHSMMIQQVSRRINMESRQIAAEEAISKTWLTTKMLLMTLCISLIFEAIIIIGLWCFDLPPNVVFLIGIICVMRGLTATVVYVYFFGKKERALII
ncbi:uncharacterized protein LOC132195707 isoform X1 [Neocloeon triangulifer]|uniref:uncharacterized protein LOC132195707 isoform X1 n=1 Tax=Neocloeon triangulifer TaxID=2078957 RepID=UPI00286F1D6C|nr:uncharacterized protein LOC132195707 isoform X1 [Neocloeon triangulifer]